MLSANQKRLCIFCGKPGKITAEHFYPDWMGKLFGKGGYDFSRKDSSGNIINQWGSSQLDMKACSPCWKCNSGWMSDLENLEAKPVLSEIILNGSAATLMPRGIESIAAFLFKTMVIADVMRPATEPPFFSSSIRRQFSRNLQIPYGVHMWISALDASVGRRGIVRSFYSEAGGILKGCQFYIFTYGVGWILLQGIASRWNKKSRRPFVFPILQQSNVWDQCATAFWPLSGKNLSWPPFKHMHHNMVDILANRWKRFDNPPGKNLFISL